MKNIFLITLFLFGFSGCIETKIDPSILNQGGFVISGEFNHDGGSQWFVGEFNTLSTATWDNINHLPITKDVCELEAKITSSGYNGTAEFLYDDAALETSFGPSLPISGAGTFSTKFNIAQTISSGLQNGRGFGLRFPAAAAGNISYTVIISTCN
jgi:hypothetical protein